MVEDVDRPELPEDLFDLPTTASDAIDGATEAPASDLAKEAGGNLPLFEEDTELEVDLAARSAAGSPAGAVAPVRGGLFDGDWSGARAEPPVAAAGETSDSAWDLPMDEGEERLDDEAEYDAVAAPLLSRLQAGCADLLVHVAVVAGSLLAMNLLGLRAEWSQWPGFVAFLVLFSFLYLAFPLAFWGQTPGMAWFRLRAREDSDRPLAFGQTGLRVLAAWLTILLAGLPTFLALVDGRSLVDRLSGSLTLID